MTEGNGSVPDFTHKLDPFIFEGHTFHRRKIDAREWAETLARVGTRERAEIDKTEGSVLFGVSSDGLYELVTLGVAEEDMEEWKALRAAGKFEFGELADLRDWMWEKMTERPFTSATPSSDGPGENSEASSKDELSSPVATPTG